MQIPEKENRIRERIAELVGTQRYRVWFHNSTRLSVTDGFLKVGVPNLFIGNWIEKHFSDAIAAAARDVVGRDMQVSYSIEPGLFSQLRKTQLNSQAEFIHRAPQRPARDGRSSSDGDTPDRPRLRGRLDDFVVGPQTELAFGIARGVVQQPGSAYNPVFFHGGCGIGKTHLLHGIANSLSETRPDLRWRYVSGEQFTNEFLLSLKNGKLESFRLRYRELDVLLIDDVHFLSNKRATQDEFLHTYNAIFASGRQVILASDAHPKMIGQLSDSLVNRFVAGVVLKLEPPDFATRCEILRRRAAAMGRPMPDDVIAYVAERIQTNVRELEGALLKLVAAATVMQTEVSVRVARQVLEDHLSRTVPILTVGDIELVVSTFFALTPADLHSSRKSRTVALARNIAMYLAREHTRLSLPEIGRLCGNKNHTTVLLAHRKIRNLHAADSEVEWITPGGTQKRKIRELVGTLEEQTKR